MTEQCKELCAKAMGVREIERCCGNCKYGDYGYDGDFGCTHPKQMEFADKEDRKSMSPFGHFGNGIHVGPTFVCNCWVRYE